jgi:hypothetical protein
MKSEIEYYGMYHIPVKATNVLCPDGIYRTARITAEADTFFTIPAQVQVRGKTVSGYLTHETNDPDDILSFHANGTNAGAFFTNVKDALEYVKKVVSNPYFTEFEVRSAPGMKKDWYVKFTRPYAHSEEQTLSWREF